MAKRFFDTELWKKDWFLDLPIKHKLLVLFLFENCDCAGIWEFNFRLASFLIGETVSIEDVNFINSKKEQFIIFCLAFCLLFHLLWLWYFRHFFCLVLCFSRFSFCLDWFMSYQVTFL